MVDAHAELVARQAEPIGFICATPRPCRTRWPRRAGPSAAERGARRDRAPRRPLRSDIAYARRVSIGAFPQLALARAALAEVGAVDIVGAVSGFDLVAFDGRTANRLRPVALSWLS